MYHIRTVTHPQHQADFEAGFHATLADIRGMGFNAARDKFNRDNPLGYRPSSLAAFYYADGGISALVEAAR